jgi:hypothetical protein
MIKCGSLNINLHMNFTGISPHAAKKKIGATYWGVEKKEFAGTRFWKRGLGMSIGKQEILG